MRTLVICACFLLLLFASAASAAVYDVDPVHSSVGFSAQHLMISHVKGVFEDYKASFTTDDRNNFVSARAEIKAKSINTRVEKRDEDLRSANFFEVDKYPDITFETISVTHLKDGKFRIKGKLTIKGITHDITMNGSMTGPVKDPWGGTRMGFKAEGKVDRKGFGLTWDKPMVAGVGVQIGEEIGITLEGEGVLQK